MSASFQTEVYVRLEKYNKRFSTSSGSYLTFSLVILLGYD